MTDKIDNITQNSKSTSTSKNDSKTLIETSSDINIMKDDIQIADSIRLPEESLAGVDGVAASSKKKHVKTSDSKTTVLNTDKSCNQPSPQIPQSNDAKTTPKIKTEESRTETSDTSSLVDHIADTSNNSGSISENMSGESKESTKFSTSIKEDASKTTDANLEKNNPENDSVVETEEVCSDKDASSQNTNEKPVKKGPAHAAAPSKDGNDSAAVGKTIKVKKARKGMKRLLVAFMSCLAVLCVGYFAGTFIFMGHVMPNTFINDESVALMDKDELSRFAQNITENYSLSISGQGMNQEIDSNAMGLSVDGDGFASKMISAQNPWLWPFEILKNRNNIDILSSCLFLTNMQDAVSDAVDEVNQSGSHPANAYISLDEEDSVFFIVPEVPGSMLDKDLVAKAASVSAKELNTKLELEDNVLVEPTVLSEDPRLLEALAKANEIKDATLTITLGGNPVDELNPAIIAPWLIISDDLNVEVNSDAVRQWADTVSSKYNTVGKTRTYTRPDGKAITVSGGTYGWKVNNDSLVELISASLTGIDGTIEIPAEQEGNGYGVDSGRDWGNRYVDIDLSEQYARFYDENANLIWESAIVSGAYGKNDTPTGVYRLNNKATNMMLRGPLKEDGTYEWESHVDYWMPFKGGSFGLHDATWQSAFGGSRFKQGYGSHGCVNLPYSAAQSLYGMIQIGDVVVVHY